MATTRFARVPMSLGMPPGVRTIFAIGLGLLVLAGCGAPERVRLKLVYPREVTGRISVDRQTERIQSAVDIVAADFGPFYISRDDIYFPEVEFEYPWERDPDTSLTLHVGGTRSVKADEEWLYSIVPVRLRTSARATYIEGGAGFRRVMFRGEGARVSGLVRATAYLYRINQSVTIGGLYNYHRDYDGEGVELDFGLGGEVDNRHPWFHGLPEGLSLGVDLRYSATIKSELGSANRWSVAVGVVKELR